MQIVSLFVFTFSFLMVICMFETIYGDKSAFEKTLVNFLELHMDNCGTIPACTIKEENNKSLHTASVSCCKSCSCDTACVEMGTCCPDSSLASLNDDIVMADLSDTHHLAQYSKLFEGQFQERKKKTHQHLNCIEAKMFADIKLERLRNSYWMVDSCINDTSDGLKVTIKCKSGFYQSDEFDPDVVVPITSLKTNTTYKNVYCYRCNEHYDGSWDIIPWTVKYVDMHSYTKNTLDNPYNQMKIMTAKTMSSVSNIFFKPRKHIQHVVSRCEPLAIKSCPDGSDAQLNEICELYHLPVIEITFGTRFKRYNNIACYLCNKQKLFRSDCSNDYSSTDLPTFEMNLLFYRHGSMLRIETQSQVLNISVGEDLGGNSSCTKGFIRSVDMVTCKRVLCPRHFFPLNGSCIPAFTLTKNISYTVMMEVLHVQKVHRISKNIFRQVYLDYIEQLAARFFERFTFGLWEISEDYDALILTFTMPIERTYLNVITSLSRFLTKIALLKINTRLEEVDVVTLISRDGNLIYFRGKLIKVKDHTPLPSLNSYNWLEECSKELLIGTSNLCYRAEFDPTEIYWDQVKASYVVTNTGTLLTPHDVQVKDEGTAFCLEDYYHDLIDMDASYMFGISRERMKAEYMYLQLKARNSSDANDKDTKSFLDDLAGSSREVVITVVMVLVVAVICIVKIVKKRNVRPDG